MKINPKLDLVLERVVDIPVRLVWMAWTTPKHLMPWFCPKPWQVTECMIDLRPGGRFFTMMQGPEGQKHPNEGCYLEVVKYKKLVWTDGLVEGYRPSANPFMTGIILMEAKGRKTKYTAMALHKDEEIRATHEKMGFHDGWGKALDQLVDYVQAL